MVARGRAWRGGRFGAGMLLAACAAACLAGCATDPLKRAGATTASFGPVELLAIDRRLAEELAAMLGPADPSFATVVALPFADDIEDMAEPGDGADSSGLHQLFLLSDRVDENNPNRSVLRAYQAVTESARCLPWLGDAPVGCRLLEDAKLRLAGTPDRAPPYSRPDFPSWKVVLPQPWPPDAAAWTDVEFDVAQHRLRTQLMFVTLHRPWMSEEFLVAGGWYLVGACKASVSGSSRDDGQRDLLPQIAIGLILARNLSLSRGAETGPPSIAWRAPRVIARLYRRLPASPLQSDPCRTDCGEPETTRVTCSPPGPVR